MNWQMPGLPGMTGPSLAQGGQEMLTWGATPVQVYQDRTSGNAEQPRSMQDPPVPGGKPQSAATSGHAERDRHVSWVRQGAQEPPADDDLPDQHQNAEWRGAAALDSPGSQAPDMSANVVPLAAAVTQLQLQNRSQSMLQPASGFQQLAPNEVQQAAQKAAQATPPAAAAALTAQVQPAPAEAASALQPAQAESGSLPRAATPAAMRRWVRPKPVQQRSWNDSTQSMGTVMRKQLPPAPPRARSSKPLHSSPLFTARSAQKLSAEQRLSTGGSVHPSPAKSPPHRQASAGRLAVAAVPQSRLPQAQNQPQQPAQSQQLYRAQQPVVAMPMPPGPRSVVHPLLAQQQLMMPAPATGMPMPATMAGNAHLKQQQQSTPYGHMLMPAEQSRGFQWQQQHQQQQLPPRTLGLVSHQNSPAQMQTQRQHANKSAPQTMQPQLQQWQQQLANGHVPESQAPWLQGSSQQAPWMQGAYQQQTLPAAAPAMLQASAGGIMPPQQPRMQPAQLQAWPVQQQPSRQPSPAPPRARTQSSGRGTMYGRQASVSGADQQPSSRAPSIAGSAGGSSTGGGRREWNGHFTKKTTRRRTAAIEPPRPTQPYTERLKSMAQRRSRGLRDDADAARNNAASIAMQQPEMLPQYGVPSTPWPQQQPWPGPPQSSSTWGSMAGGVYPEQYGGWPPLQVAQWGAAAPSSAPLMYR